MPWPDYKWITVDLVVLEKAFVFVPVGIQKHPLAWFMVFKPLAFICVAIRVGLLAETVFEA